MKYLIAVFLLCCSMQQAVAGGYTGGNLKQDIDRLYQGKPNLADSFKSGYVLGYINGIGTQMVMSREICLPPGMNPEQAIQIVKSYISTVPQYQKYQAGTLIHVALQKALPCVPNLQGK